MKKIAAFPLIALGFLMMPASSDTAEAVVYCKTVGVPKGCVVRPAPAVRRTVVRRSSVNLGGPVNRVGVR
jgi:hypothetical protein